MLLSIPEAWSETAPESGEISAPEDTSLDSEDAATDGS